MRVLRTIKHVADPLGAILREFPTTPRRPSDSSRMASRHGCVQNTVISAYAMIPTRTAWRKLGLSFMAAH
jgi:hypothetical protein